MNGLRGSSLAVAYMTITVKVILSITTYSDYFKGIKAQKII